VFDVGCVVDGRKRNLPDAPGVRLNSDKLRASSPALLRDYIGHETESSGPGKNHPPHAGTLQPVCGRVLARHTRSRRQPEHRGTIAIHRNEPPFKILDFGCGAGRDLKTFAELGHIAIGLEGAVHLAVMARAHSGCEVWQQDFLKLDLPDNHFDGVFANAALFHVPSQELPRVLLELKASLKPGGVLFSSNPRGHNEEGWSQGRYGVYHDLDA